MVRSAGVVPFVEPRLPPTGAGESPTSRSWHSRKAAHYGFSLYHSLLRARTEAVGFAAGCFDLLTTSLWSAGVVFGGLLLLILLTICVPERFGSLKLSSPGISEQSLAFSQKITWDMIQGATKGTFHDTFIGVLENTWGLPRAITSSRLFRVQLAPLQLFSDVLCLRAPRATSLTHLLLSRIFGCEFIIPDIYSIPLGEIGSHISSPAGIELDVTGGQGYRGDDLPARSNRLTRSFTLLAAGPERSAL